MKVDIIGSKFTRKLTEFKNFRFDVNNAVLDQSILSLLSDPYEVVMKDINTTNLNDITVAYRDLNKLLYPNLKSSDSEVIIVELLSELNDISEFEHSFYNTSSLELINDDLNYKNLSTIEKFRAIQRKMEEFIRLLNQYEKVIFLKLLPKENEKKDFIEGIYRLLERNIEHKLLLSIDNDDLNKNLEVPLEVYTKVNEDLKKFSSDNYYNQLLFDEYLVDNILSVYINHVEEREYMYELYKDGRPCEKSKPTTSRFYNYKLSEPGKYRIRVHVTDESANPRFSQTYEFTPEKYTKPNINALNYIEIPSKENMWMLDLIIQKVDFLGLIGNPYRFPEDYAGYKVFLSEEVKDEEYLKQEELHVYSIQIIADMGEEEFNMFVKNNGQIKRKNPFLYEFFIYIRKQSSF